MNKKQAAFLSLVVVILVTVLACLVSWGAPVSFLNALVGVLAVIGFICALIAIVIGVAVAYDRLGNKKY